MDLLLNQHLNLPRAQHVNQLSNQHLCQPLSLRASPRRIQLASQVRNLLLNHLRNLVSNQHLHRLQSHQASRPSFPPVSQLLSLRTNLAPNLRASHLQVPLPNRPANLVASQLLNLLRSPLLYLHPSLHPTQQRNLQVCLLNNQHLNRPHIQQYNLPLCQVPSLHYNLLLNQLGFLPPSLPLSRLLSLRVSHLVNHPLVLHRSRLRCQQSILRLLLPVSHPTSQQLNRAISHLRNQRARRQISHLIIQRLNLLAFRLYSLQVYPVRNQVLTLQDSLVLFQQCNQLGNQPRSHPDFRHLSRVQYHHRIHRRSPHRVQVAILRLNPLVNQVVFPLVFHLRFHLLLPPNSQRLTHQHNQHVNRPLSQQLCLQTSL